MGLESIRQQAEAKFNAALQVEEGKRKQVGRLLILTVDDVELLDGLALRHSPETVICEYADFVTKHPKVRAGSFRSFVLTSRYNNNLPRLIDTMAGKCYQKAIGYLLPELERRYAEAEAAARRIAGTDAPAA